MVDISSLKVLIIDDHFLARQIVTDVMREMNVTNVMAVGDGHAGRDALDTAYKVNEPFNVVFLDRNIPNLEGLELLKQFRARPEFNTTAFIMLTSASEQSDVLMAVKAGANGYLIKPVTKAAISKKMKETVGWLDQQQKSA